MMHLTAIEKEEQEQVEKLGGKLQTEKDYCSKWCIEIPETLKY